MPFKPVGVDENSQFPPRVQLALGEMFVTKPDNIADGQFPMWDATSQTWVPGTPSAMSGSPSAIDGGAPTP